MRIFRNRHWELFCITAVWQEITKIIILFYRIAVWFQYSLLNKQIYNLLKMKYFTGIFLGIWSKGPSFNFTEHLFFFSSCEWLLLIISLTNAIKKIWQVNNQIIITMIIIHQIPKEKLKQLHLWNCCLVFPNGSSLLQCNKLQASNARQYSFRIFSVTTRINSDQNNVCFSSNYLQIFRSQALF